MQYRVVHTGYCGKRFVGETNHAELAEVIIYAMKNRQGRTTVYRDGVPLKNCESMTPLDKWPEWDSASPSRATLEIST